MYVQEDGAIETPYLSLHSGPFVQFARDLGRYNEIPDTTSLSSARPSSRPGRPTYFRNHDQEIYNRANHGHYRVFAHKDSLGFAFGIPSTRGLSDSRGTIRECDLGQYFRRPPGDTLAALLERNPELVEVDPHPETGERNFLIWPSRKDKTARWVHKLADVAIVVFGKPSSG